MRLLEKGRRTGSEEEEELNWAVAVAVVGILRGN